MSTTTAYRNMTPAQRTRHNFLYELTRHHGVVLEQTSANTYKALVDAPIATAVILKFTGNTALTVSEVIGRDPAREIATFADFSRFQFAVSTLIQSAVER